MRLQLFSFLFATPGTQKICLIILNQPPDKDHLHILWSKGMQLTHHKDRSDESFLPRCITWILLVCTEHLFPRGFFCETLLSRLHSQHFGKYLPFLWLLAVGTKTDFKLKTEIFSISLTALTSTVFQAPVEQTKAKISDMCQTTPSEDNPITSIWCSLHWQIAVNMLQINTNYTEYEWAEWKEWMVPVCRHYKVILMFLKEKQNIG